MKTKSSVRSKVIKNHSIVKNRKGHQKKIPNKLRKKRKRDKMKYRRDTSMRFELI